MELAGPLDARDHAIAGELGDQRVLVVANKRDLVAHRGVLPQALEGRGPGLPNWPVSWTSALTGEGLHELEAQMAALVKGGEVAPTEEALGSNPRHQAP